MSEPIPKALRFEVFKRDSFSCQYCGRRAPDVVLHCDHITPVAAGGTTEILNLIAACVDCNLGKGARLLSDNAAITKQLDQLAELQERRDQLEMLLAWRRELASAEANESQRLSDYWAELSGWELNAAGVESVARLIKRFGTKGVVEAMDTSARQYLVRDETGRSTEDSFEKAFDYIGRIAGVTRAEQREPGLRRVFYIRGILRNRLQYVNEQQAVRTMRDAVSAGVPIDLIERLAKECRSWTQFREWVEQTVEDVAEQARLMFEWCKQTAREVRALMDDDIPEDDIVRLIYEAVEAGVDTKKITGGFAGDIQWPGYKALIEREIRLAKGEPIEPPDEQSILGEWRKLNDIIQGKIG